MQIIGLDTALRKVVNIEKQVRFATAQALNDTAKDVQAFTVNHLLPSKFTLRAKGNPWQKPGTKFGFNIKFANKAKLESTIGSQADWLKEQEAGGTKDVKGRRIAIPTRYWKTKAEIMRASKKPRAVKRAWVSDGSGKLKAGIWGRVGSALFPIKYLFALRGSVTVKPVLRFGPEGMALARRLYPVHFNRRLAHAILTAK